ncbi:hypothetical protein BDFB_014501 [Asbolus verrucosus]|uniref:Uncharacterized protein n=1 Tax=Asbolus verrucosus TaxID=1661398 RepID=A0A482VQU0_ASBVE|nr:hypothetical protein BDFB_014501 [Asbolus verrucosus]
MEFHTYTPAEEKTHAFVLRGLDQRPTPEEIAEDPENNYNLQADKIYEMKGTARPLYLVVMDKKITIDKLEKQIRIVLYTKMSRMGACNLKLPCEPKMFEVCRPSSDEGMRARAFKQPKMR